MGQDRMRGFTARDAGATDTLDAKEKVTSAWEKVEGHGIGLWLREHTPLVADIARPEAGAGDLAALPLVLILTPCLLLAILLHAPVLALAGVILSLASAPLLIVFWACYRDSDTRARDDMRTRRGLMGAREAAKSLGAKSIADGAVHAMPATWDAWRAASPHGTPLPARWMGVKIGTTHGIGAWLSMEQPVYVLAPPRQGKTTGFVIPIVLEAPGPVVVTSSRKDVLDATWSLKTHGWEDRTRRQLDPADGDAPLSGKPGRCWIFDPMGIAADGSPDPADPDRYRHNLNWDPIAPCTDPAVARSCAEALVATVGLTGDNKTWGNTATQIVQSLLLAAALEDKTLGDVYGWVQNVESIQAAVLILERQSANQSLPQGTRNTAAKWAAEVRRLKSEDVRLVGSKMLGVTGAFSSLSLPQVRRSLSPDPTRPPFSMADFVRSNDTIYFLCQLRPVEGQGSASAGAFVSMFLTQLRDEIRRQAAAQPGGRVEPYVTLCIDECDNIESWNDLPQVYTAGSGEGIWPVTFHQSRDAARAAFGKGEAQMWESSQKVVLGGLSVKTELDEISAICGTRRVRVRDGGHFDPRSPFLPQVAGQASDRTESKPVLDDADITHLPKGMALLIAAQHTPAIVETQPWYKRHYEEARP